MGSINISKKIFFVITILLFLAIIYLPSICAEEYYADITIDVDSFGYVTIEGTTNYPNLTVKDTEIYTSKKQSNWLLNITKKEIFSEFIYTLTLPQGSSINYLNASGFINIKENQGYLLITGYGENESLSIIIQYQTEKTSDNNLFGLDFVNIILITAIVIMAIILIFYLFKERKKEALTEGLTDNVTGYDFKGLNDRQKQIMKLLIDKKIPLTQTDIQKELNIPKAAVSRNIHGLEHKGLIEKEQIGMSNLIRLKKT